MVGFFFFPIDPKKYKIIISYRLITVQIEAQYVLSRPSHVLHSHPSARTCASQGRPLAIYDGDCDVELPSDCEDETEDDDNDNGDDNGDDDTHHTKQLAKSDPEGAERAARAVSATSSTGSDRSDTRWRFAFVQLVRLSQILGEILSRLYSAKANALGFELGVGMESSVKVLKTKLDEWRAQLPEQLRLDLQILEKKEKLPSFVGK